VDGTLREKNETHSTGRLLLSSIIILPTTGGGLAAVNCTQPVNWQVCIHSCTESRYIERSDINKSYPMRHACVQAFHVVVELTMSVTSSSLNRISKFVYRWKVLLNLQHNHINLPTTPYRVAALPREVRKSDFLLVACRSRAYSNCSIRCSSQVY